MNGRQPFSAVMLLTSTIKPPGMSDEMVRVRHHQYEKGIEYWMRHRDERIAGVVYCDNSEPDLDWAKNLASKHGGKRAFEAIYCPDNQGIPGLHYGYQEMGLIDFALENSKLLGDAEFFMKVTGRLLFPRISFLLDRLPSSFNACIDHRRAYRHEDKKWARIRARTQLMIFRKSFFLRHLKNKRPLMAENKIVDIEEFIPSILSPDKPCGKEMIFRWPVECPPSGIGGNGDDYDSIKRKIKSLIQGCARRIAPWIWL